MRQFVAALALVVLTAAPAFAEDAFPGLPDTTQAPKLSASQLDAIKRQLDASPRTPGRAAMMQKLLKLALAMKNKQPVATADMLALVAYLRESNAGQASNPAFAGALQQLEGAIMKLNAAPGENPDLDELKKEFEGW